MEDGGDCTCNLPFFGFVGRYLVPIFIYAESSRRIRSMRRYDERKEKVVI